MARPAYGRTVLQELLLEDGRPVEGDRGGLVRTGDPAAGAELRS
ncbi:hypothetical protein AB0C89_07860 [Streptomyces sp. NPDC048491]|nr:hypothetical protein [Streptomyces sp. CB01201]